MKIFARWLPESLAIPDLFLRRSKCVQLPIRSRTQLQDYTCGPVAAWSIAKALAPDPNHDRLWRICAPHPDCGCGTESIIQALQSQGLTVKTVRKVSFESLRATIISGCAVMTCIHRLG